MKLKNIPLFYKIYISAIIVFLIALTVFSFLLSNNLKHYNEGIAETVSQKFFDETFVKLDVEKILTMSGISQTEFETSDDTKNLIKDSFSKNLSFTAVSSDSEDDKKYIVKSGQSKLATFILSRNENDDFYPSSLSLHLKRDHRAKVKILDSSSLFINGIKVSEEYIVSTELHKNASNLPENVKKPAYVTYEITGLSKTPLITVTDRNGNVPSLIEKDGVLCEEIIYDADEPELTSHLLNAAKKYSACMQNDVSKSSIYPFFEKGTDLYESIRTVENTFVWDHSGYSIENENTSEFLRYDENTVSLRISFIHVLKKHGKEDFRDAFDATFFARNIDGEYKIFAMYNN